MEAYVTETAEEGEAVALVTKWPDAMGGSEGVNSGHEGTKEPTPGGSLPCQLVPTDTRPRPASFFQCYWCGI